MRNLAALALCALTLACAAGCHREPKTPAQLIGQLQSPDAKQRQDAADDLRTDTGVPPEAIQPLLAAIQNEKDPHAYGALLITLGRSGAPEAKALIDAKIPEMDADMRRWAGRALKYWMIANQKLPADPQLPDGWPYGQPGFPAPLPDKK